jgi:predicted  nucleic acid-binding Zn-ribbon protein
VTTEGPPKSGDNVFRFRPQRPEWGSEEWSRLVLEEWEADRRAAVAEAEREAEANTESYVAEVNDAIRRAENYGGPKPVNDDGSVGQSPRDRQSDEIIAAANKQCDSAPGDS